MVFAIAGIVVGFIALASIVVISIVGFNKANYIQGDYNTKVKDVVDQVNSAQYYEYEFDKKHKAQTNDLSKNVDDVRNTYLTKDDATSTYVKKTDAGTAINTATLNVADNLKADKNFSETNKIRFSNKWTGFPDNATDKSEISNDTDGFKKLMIVGNKSAGGERKVGIWDKLDVHGNLGVDRSATVGGNFSIDGATMYNKGRQHIHGEELLYLLNRSGVIIGKEWGGNGNLNVQGNLGVGGNIPGDWRGVNMQRRDGRWSHLDWKDNGANYLRGYTQVDDGLGVSGNANVTGDIVKNGGNNWIIHTPDDGRRTMYIAPSKAAGNQDWDWDKNMNINENGDLNVRGKTTIARGDGNWNWLRVAGNHKDNIYLGSDHLNRGIWADGPRDFSIYNQGNNGLTVTQGGEVNINKKANIGNFSVDGATIYNRGRMHVHGEELLYLLNKSGVVIGKEWGGNGNLSVQGTIYGTVNTSSDKTLKKNIADVSTEEVNKLSQLDPKSYQFIDDKNNTKRFGFVAQDVEKVYPNLVSDGQDGKKALNYTDMIPLAVAGIQKINKQVQPDKLCINNVCLTESDLLKLKKL